MSEEQLRPPSTETGLATEITAVEQELLKALSDLNPPFSQLVHRQFERIYPLLRAGVVLATAFEDTEEASLRTRRIYLGAALEMLHLALRIHTRLLDVASGSEAADRSLLGSTILAGDYCFSRAADLAVRTGNPAVVDIFAHALKRASEGHLRQLLEATARFDEGGELLRSGGAAASELAGFSPEIRAAQREQAEVFAAHLQDTLSTREPAGTPLPADVAGGERLSAGQRARWAQLYRQMVEAQPAAPR